MPVTTLFVRWMLDGQRPKWWAWCVAALAIVGVSLVAGLIDSGTQHLNASTWRGDLMAFVGSFGWVLYTRGQSRTAGLTVIEYTAFAALLSLPVLIGFVGVATAIGWAHMPSGDNAMAVWPSLIYVVAIPTVFAALAFNYGVRQLGATNGIVFINFVPVSALLIGCALGHWPSATEVLGVVMVVSALLFQARRMSGAR